MTDEQKQRRRRRRDVSDETKIKQSIDLIEELSWLLDSRKVDLKEIPSLLRNRLLYASPVHGSGGKQGKSNSNVEGLIGVLPGLFQDTNLFSRNEDIADFAREVLDIQITRVQKRSKYELIGLIVCEANTLADDQLGDLVEMIKNVVGDKANIDQVAKEKSSEGFSWNIAIRNLSKQ